LDQFGDLRSTSVALDKTFKATAVLASVIFKIQGEVLLCRNLHAKFFDSLKPRAHLEFEAIPNSQFVSKMICRKATAVAGLQA